MAAVASTALLPKQAQKRSLEISVLMVLVSVVLSVARSAGIIFAVGPSLSIEILKKSLHASLG